MKSHFDKHRDFWGPLFTHQLHTWAREVFSPASVLIDSGQLEMEQWGNYPLALEKGSGKYFSLKGIQLYLLPQQLNNERVKYFDFAAAEYEMATHDYKKHLTEKTFKELIPYLKDDFRIVDCGCGPGYEAIALSKIVSKGEVVAIDLSAQMISLACKNAKYEHVTNMCFYQADVHNMPEVLLHRFDAVFCQLNSSYFDDMSGVAENFFNLLQSRGFVWLIEPYPSVPNMLSIQTAKAAIPHFKRFYTREELQQIFLNVGFTEFFWKEIMPGIGLSIVTKNNRNV